METEIDAPPPISDRPSLLGIHGGKQIWYLNDMTGFIQSAPELGNQFDSDSVLKDYIRFRVPDEYRVEIEQDLQKFGDRVANQLLELSSHAEQSPPSHRVYDAWGERIDEIVVDDAWNKLHEVAAEEGIVSIGYERKQSEYSRVYQFAKLFMFHPSSAFYSCPLAMTDGAARMIEVVQDKALLREVFPKLISRDPNEMWTSGQWMTEKIGGSDVSRTETIAKKEGDVFRLYGLKWFSSATTADIAMALARIEGDPEGSKGLSVFYIKLRDEHGRLQNISINRLKDKLGTKALPTAELTLEGTPAQLVGERGAGVATISSLFNVTRLYNSMCALGTIRRGIALASSYAEQRSAFGAKLGQLPLHAETLSQMQTEFAGSFHLAMHLGLVLGREETGKATAEEILLLRMLTPVAKLYTAKKSISISSEVLECFGGAGYIEDTNLPELLRNAQVFSIWEGTTNVLALDLLRAIQKEKAFVAFNYDVTNRLKSVNNSVLASEVKDCLVLLDRAQVYVDNFASSDGETMQAGARDLAFFVAELFAASLLLELANWAIENNEMNAERSVALAKRWMELRQTNLYQRNQKWREDSMLTLS